MSGLDWLSVCALRLAEGFVLCDVMGIFDWGGQIDTVRWIDDDGGWDG